MTIIAPEISNRNFLNPINFAIKIDKTTKNVEYTCQSVSLPSVSIGPATQSTPKRGIPLTGDKVDYEPFAIRFIVDETMDNYKEILNWLRNQANMIEDVRDITLIIYNSSNLPSIKIRFLNAFPTNLETIPFDVTQTEVNIQCGATFYYSSFEFES